MVVESECDKICTAVDDKPRWRDLCKLQLVVRESQVFLLMFRKKKIISLNSSYFLCQDSFENTVNLVDVSLRNMPRSFHRILKFRL